MKQRNNHARSKRKRKLLRLKNKMSWVIDHRLAKAKKKNKPKGVTIIGDAVDFAKRVPYGFYNRRGGKCNVDSKQSTQTKKAGPANGQNGKIIFSSL